MKSAWRRARQHHRHNWSYQRVVQRWVEPKPNYDFNRAVESQESAVQKANSNQTSQCHIVGFIWKTV